MYKDSNQSTYLSMGEQISQQMNLKMPLFKHKCMGHSIPSRSLLTFDFLDFFHFSYLYHLIRDFETERVYFKKCAGGRVRPL